MRSTGVRCAQHQHEECLVWRARQRHVYQGRDGYGVGGEGGRGGSAVQAVRPAGGMGRRRRRATIYLKRCRVTLPSVKCEAVNDGSLKSECSDRTAVHPFE